MVTEDVGTYTLPGFVCDRKLCYLSLGRNKPFIIIILSMNIINILLLHNGPSVIVNKRYNNQALQFKIEKLDS